MKSLGFPKDLTLTQQGKLCEDEGQTVFVVLVFPSIPSWKGPLNHYWTKWLFSVALKEETSFCWKLLMGKSPRGELTWDWEEKELF